MRNALLWGVLGSIACKSTPSPTAAPTREAPLVAAVEASPPQPPPAGSAPDVAPLIAPVDVKASAAAALAKLPPDQVKRAKAYGALIGALAKCSVDSSGALDKQCKSFQAIGDDRDRQRNDRHWLDVQRAAWWMHADTLSTSVRAYLMHDVATFEEDLAAVLIDVEPDEKQLAHRLAVVRGHFRWSMTPILVKAVTARTAHPADEVRRRALWALSAVTPPPPGVHTTLVTAIDRDPSPHVRRETCRVAGQSKDDRMLAVFDRLLVPSTEAELFDACAEGLTTMWTLPADGHEAAYRRTLRLIDTGRRDTPMRTTWETLTLYGRDRLEAFAKDTPWMTDAEVRAVLERRILDRTANPVGRVGATMAFVRFGTADHLNALHTKLTGSKGSEEDPVVECINLAVVNTPSCHTFFLGFTAK